MNKKSKNKRIDNILVEKGFFETKSKAQASIMAGDVKINDQICIKAGTQFKEDEFLDIKIKTFPYVSRGGIKLEKAIKEFKMSCKDKICLDAGASTGGFTDSLLKNGAKKIYAVDVGYGQLAWELRNNCKVQVIERTNIRNASVNEVYKDIDPANKELLSGICVMDLSFISVKKVLENIKKLLNPQKFEAVMLIKPQFEAGKDLVPRTGVIKDIDIHVNVIKDILIYACTLGFYPVNLTYSPIKGTAGNIEYLAYFTNKESHLDEDFVKGIVNQAHECFLSS